MNGLIDGGCRLEDMQRRVPGGGGLGKVIGDRRRPPVERIVADGIDEEQAAPDLA